MEVRLDAASTTCTHLIWDGADGWIPAVAVTMPWGEPGWHFWRVEDCIRWLHAPGDD